VIQCHCAGTRLFLPDFLKILVEKTDCRAVIDRSDLKHLSKEGLETVEKILWKKADFKTEELKKFLIREEGLIFKADLLNGQKTGFYLDQRETRAFLKKIAKGKNCLDAFCNSGSFSVILAKSGAQSVLGLDSSEHALELAVNNAALNKTETLCRFEKQDLFKDLTRRQKSGESYDLIILDPPKMCVDRSGLLGALRGYREIQYRAFKMLKHHGILITCSCTQAVTATAFERLAWGAASQAKVKVRQIYQAFQPADHPVRPGMPESNYLKILGFQKID
jgi:23S rRNA (cytosine1962-C5)-methyltransferase